MKNASDMDRKGLNKEFNLLTFEWPIIFNRFKKYSWSTKIFDKLIKSITFLLATVYASGESLY